MVWINCKPDTHPSPTSARVLFNLGDVLSTVTMKGQRFYTLPHTQCHTLRVTHTHIQSLSLLHTHMPSHTLSTRSSGWPIRFLAHRSHTFQVRVSEITLEPWIHLSQNVWIRVFAMEAPQVVPASCTCVSCPELSVQKGLQSHPVLRRSPRWPPCPLGDVVPGWDRLGEEGLVAASTSRNSPKKTHQTSLIYMGQYFHSWF